MTTENLVTIDFDTEPVNNNREIDANEKNQNSSNFLNQEIDLIPDVSFKVHNNLEDSEGTSGEAQPLLGVDHHDHITYNQFPGKRFTILRVRRKKVSLWSRTAGKHWFYSLTMFLSIFSKCSTEIKLELTNRR